MITASIRTAILAMSALVLATGRLAAETPAAPMPVRNYSGE